MRAFRRLRRACRALVGAAAALSVIALLARGGAAAMVEPSLQLEPLPGDAEVTYTVVDPLQVSIGAAVAGGNTPQCAHSGCQATIAELVHQGGAALGFTANYSNGVDVLGLAVVDHHQLAAADPHTTTLCVGDAAVPGQRPPLSITKDADATRCRTAVSGEQVVAGGAPSIEGLADDGRSGHFWWSVQHFRRVERTLVGLRPDGTLLVAVATSRRSGVRNGMTLPEAAAWLVAHGVGDAIALDGGHQADVFSTQHGSQVPLERGLPTMQMALLLGAVQPAPAGPVSTAPSPQPAAAPAPGRPVVPAAGHEDLRVDGVVLQSHGARAALAVHLGAPASPQSGLAGGDSAVTTLDGDGPAQLDGRWLMAARVGHHLPDVDPAPGPPAVPDSGVAGAAR